MVENITTETFCNFGTGVNCVGEGRGQIDGVSILRLVKRVFCVLFSLCHPNN